MFAHNYDNLDDQRRDAVMLYPFITASPYSWNSKKSPQPHLTVLIWSFPFFAVTCRIYVSKELLLWDNLG